MDDGDDSSDDNAQHRHDTTRRAVRSCLPPFLCRPADDVDVVHGDPVLLFGVHDVARDAELAARPLDELWGMWRVCVDVEDVEDGDGVSVDGDVSMNDGDGERECECERGWSE